MRYPNYQRGYLHPKTKIHYLHPKTKVCENMLSFVCKIRLQYLVYHNGEHQDSTSYKKYTKPMAIGSIASSCKNITEFVDFCKVTTISQKSQAPVLLLKIQQV